MKTIKRFTSISFFFFFYIFSSYGQEHEILLIPEQVFDGKEIHRDWGVLIQHGLIKDAGPISSLEISNTAQRRILSGQTLMPGMIEGHSHILLHPYNETSWNDQVLKESYAERAVRAANHVTKSLKAGITTMRDLGSEGAGYLDVGIKQSIEKGIIEGPDLIVAGPAIVATGSYGPKGFADHVRVPLGAYEADGTDNLILEVRRQIGGGADIIKVYADYRWGPEGEARPTFTLEELELIVRVAASSGRKVVAHAATTEGMRRATLAGVYTIEHGDGGTREIFELMKRQKVALCPTLAAGDAIMQYRGWRKGLDPEPQRITNKRESFALALEVGVAIVAGGDVGVFPHGENVREFEMMVDYGMLPIEVLRNVTSGNATLLGLSGKGEIKSGMTADIISVYGDPSLIISDLRNIHLVVKKGRIVHLRD